MFRRNSAAGEVVEGGGEVIRLGGGERGDAFEGVAYDVVKVLPTIRSLVLGLHAFGHSQDGCRVDFPVETGFRQRGHGARKADDILQIFALIEGAVVDGLEGFGQDDSFQSGAITVCGTY